jgi:hypothetical protein
LSMLAVGRWGGGGVDIYSEGARKSSVFLLRSTSSSPLAAEQSQHRHGPAISLNIILVLRHNSCLLGEGGGGHRNSKVCEHAERQGHNLHSCMHASNTKETCAQRSGSGRQDSCNRETFPLGPDSLPPDIDSGNGQNSWGEKLCLKASPPLPPPPPPPPPLILSSSSYLPFLLSQGFLSFYFFDLSCSLSFCFSFTFVTSDSLPLVKVFFLSFSSSSKTASITLFSFFVPFVSFYFLFSIFSV